MPHYLAECDVPGDVPRFPKAVWRSSRVYRLRRVRADQPAALALYGEFAADSRCLRVVT
jgi:hypothetical protein